MSPLGTAHAHRRKAGEGAFVCLTMVNWPTTIVPVPYAHGGEGETSNIMNLRPELVHTDKLDDLAYHRAMLETGVYLCYDQGLRTPEKTATLVNEMSAAGFGSQIVLGTDRDPPPE